MKPDAIIIGTGQAGVPLALKLADAGKRVIVVERSAVGGTCVNYGCTPTKTIIASARAAHVARSAARLGVRCADVKVDFPAVVARKDATVQRWREGVEKKLRKQSDRIVLISGHATFVGPREIEVNGDRHQADTVVINVGGRPAVPPIPGLETIAWLDNAAALELKTLPEHLLVVGGGYIGCELGQMFRRLGSKVTVIDPSPHLLGRQDEDVSSELEKVFRSEGITLALGANADKVTETAAGIRVSLSNGEHVTGSHLLVATGRTPNTADLGCAAAGVRLDKRGFIEVDDHYQSSAEGIFAVGDCINQPQFTHVSWDDHRILYSWLSGRSQRGRHGRNIPWAVFTDPQIAGVGLSEREAKEKGVPFEVSTMPFGHVARAIEVDEPAGLLKVLIDPETERLIGATIVGAEAGELIHVFVALMQANASARHIVEAQMVHPAFAEGLQSVLMAAKRFSQ